MVRVNRYVAEKQAASWDLIRNLFCVGSGGDTHLMERLRDPFLLGRGYKVMLETCMHGVVLV